MDPKFRSSFIPKKPLSSKGEGGGVKRRRTSFNMMSFVASIIFVLAVAASGGVYAYAYLLEDKINMKGIELKESLDRINLSQIDDYKLLDQRLDTAWSLLLNHRITSRIFDLLEENTLHNVKFDLYEYDIEESESPTEVVVTLEGQALTYDSLVLQSDVFKQQDFVTNIVIDDIRRVDDIDALPNSGNLFFEIKIHIDKKLVEYDLQLEQESEE